MTALLAALLLQTAPAPPPATAGEEVVVVAERLRRLRFVTRRDKKTGAMRCIMRRSSGLPALDGAVCAAAIDCAATHTTSKMMIACLESRMPAIAARFGKR